MGNKRTNELIDILKYIKDELVAQYPCGTITADYFLCAVLDKPDCIAHKAIDRSVVHSEIERMREDLDSKLSNNNPAVITDNPSYDTKIQKIFDKLDRDDEIVSSGHVLCAIIESHEHIQQIFKQIRVTPQRLLVSVMECLSDEMTSEQTPSPKIKANEKKNDKKKASVSSSDTPSVIDAITYYKSESGDAERYMTNLNISAINGKLPVAVNREETYEDIFRTMSRCTKNNVILVGDGGVGKTAISKNIANLLVSDKVPKFLKEKVLLSFNIVKMFAGITMRGILDNRTKAIMEDINSKKKYIVLIDDLDTIITIAQTQDATEILSLFYSLLASSNVYVIATCTSKGYNQFIAHNSKLGEQMKRVDLRKPSVEDCCQMVMANKERFEKFHDVQYTDKTIRLCIELADKHIKERQLPDSAFDIIDEVGAGISMLADESPEIAEITNRLSDISAEKSKLRTSTNLDDYTKLDELTNEEMKLKAKKSLLEKEDRLRQEKREVTIDDVYKAVSSRIGKKVEKLDGNEKERLKNIANDLKSIIIGQDQAVDEVCRVVKRQRMKLFNTERPAVLFFSGSTGTGKTYLAKQLAEKVFGDSNALVRLDMSEYADKISVNKLYGSPSGYVGYEEGGVLTEAIKNKGRCVLLLDEIEKANDEVFNVFLQVFDDGRLTDNKGITVSFRDTIIIMTSNIGAVEASNRGSAVGFSTGNKKDISKDIIDNAIKKRFKPEFLNRIDAMVQFNKLGKEELRKIVLLEIERLSKQIEKSGYIIGESFKSNQTTDFILDSTDKEKHFGGRAIVRAVTKYIEDRIVDYIINNDVESGYVFETDEIIPEIKK